MEGLLDKTVINVDILRPLLFKDWKKVKDDWPSSFSKASVKVTPSIKILESSIIK
jgi:hypothetical protein